MEAVRWNSELFETNEDALGLRLISNNNLLEIIKGNPSVDQNFGLLVGGAGGFSAPTDKGLSTCSLDSIRV